MSTNRGIFESFPSQAPGKPDSPFAVAGETPGASVPSPFTAVAPQDSPFRVVDEPASDAPEFGKPVKLPDRRRLDSPFQVADPSEGFAFEPAAPAATSPFEAAPGAAASPFSVAPAAAPTSPFSAEPPAAPKTASPATQAAIAAFSQWQDPAAQPTSAPFAPAPAAPAQIPSAFAPPVAPPAQAAPAPAPAAAAPAASAAPAPAPAATAPAAQPEHDDGSSDSSSIRQLELRAIFGVDREMSAEEILQRSRALPGIKNIARVGTQEIAVIESLKSMLPKLGFGSGAIKIYLGSVPLDFIREGKVLLAVQTDGGFAPGVRETLMIVARELNRMG